MFVRRYCRNVLLPSQRKTAAWKKNLYPSDRIDTIKLSSRPPKAVRKDYLYENLCTYDQHTPVPHHATVACRLRSIRRTGNDPVPVQTTMTEEHTAPVESYLAIAKEFVAQKNYDAAMEVLNQAKKKVMTPVWMT